MDSLFKLKNSLEFCLTGSKDSIRNDYSVKNALDILESQSNDNKVIKKICIDCRNIILGNSDNTTMDILNLLKEIDFISINQINIINDDKISTINKSNYLKTLNISNDILKTFNDIIYTRSCSTRDKKLLEIFQYNDIKYDFRIAKGLIYGLTDKSAEIRNIVIGILLTFDKSYINYLETEIESLSKSNHKSANYLKKVVEDILEK